MTLSRTALLLALGLFAGAAIGATEIDPGDVEPAGAPDAAYLDAARWRGLQTEVVYLRPGAAPPAGEVAVPAAPGAPDPEAERRAWAIAAGMVLLLVLAFAVWHGRGIPVPFGAVRDRLRRGRHAASGEPAAAVGAASPDEFLATLAAMPDRRTAMILLVGQALERAAQVNGLRLGRAQTARDVLRTLPRRWPHLDALARLVSEAELVH